MSNERTYHYIPENSHVWLPIIGSTQMKEQQQFKRKKVQKSTRKVIANLQDTKYEVIEKVCDQLQWKIDVYSQYKDWDVKWSDSAITTQILNKMQSFQKINHFPGMNTLSRKNNLAKNLQRMQEIAPQSYSFFPRTFLLPYDAHKIKQYAQDIKKQGILKTFIVKPQANSQGRGIFMTQNINQICLSQHAVVQKYISNPLLFRGLKFDLRVYVLLAGCDPLRIYIYNEGLTRFATEKYEYPNQQNLDDLCMHLTNYAINKNSPNYLFNTSLSNLSFGHKKSMAEFFQTLKNMGLKASNYWSSIKDIIVKTIISGQPHLKHQYRIAQPNNLANNMCFQVLGFDFMIDSQDNCHLLQINHTPSFTTDTPLDDLIKSNLIKDTLILMNITEQSRALALEEARQIKQRRVMTGKTLKMSAQEREERIKEIQDIRQQYQQRHLGSYERIYPSKNAVKQQKYQDLLKLSDESYKQQSNGTKNSPYKKISKFRIKRVTTNQTLQGDEQSNAYKAEMVSMAKKNRTSNQHRNQSPNPEDKQFEQFHQQLAQAPSDRNVLSTNVESSTMFTKYFKDPHSIPNKPIIK